MDTGFKITTADGLQIRFTYYTDDAPLTCNAFQKSLPFTRLFYHARVSGQEIWIDNAPALDVPQENASIFTQPGEAVLGPVKPARTRTAGCFGIYYGEGKGLDAANIFARVTEEDQDKLKQLGDAMWKNGALEITVSKVE